MKKFKEFLRILFMVICVGVMLFSGYKIYHTYHGYHVARASYDESAERYVKPRKPKKVSSGSGTPIPTEQPLDLAPIEVDFATLQAETPDVVGWIYCPDTDFNYPIVQGTDNEYYLRRLANGEYNYSGSVFLDYRCDGGFRNRNSVIYGHNMNDDSMFAMIEAYRDPEYLRAHPEMYLLTPEADFRVTIFSGVLTDGNSDLYDYALAESFFDSYVDAVLEYSDFSTDIPRSEIKKTLTFSTCAYDFNNARYLVTGNLTRLDRQTEK